VLCNETKIVVQSTLSSCTDVWCNVRTSI